MRLPQPLIRGRLIQRYKRFFADVLLDSGEAITAHCPNPGAMLGINAPGTPVWVSRVDSASRKLAHTLELVETPTGLVGANTLSPNKIVAEALAAEAVPEITGYAVHRREAPYGEGSRVDFLLESADRPPCFLEIKNCHLSRRDGLAEFPDCVTARGLKHLNDLAREARGGARAVLMFVIQRGDCEAFDAAHDLDAAYAARLMSAAAEGVEVLCYDCDITTSEIRLGRRLPWRGATREQHSA